MQLITLVVTLLGLCQARRDCDGLIWPNYFGSGDQLVTKGLAYEHTNCIIIVGGTAGGETSPEQTGFAYAQDVYGNWLWGSSLSRRGRAMSAVSKCTVSSRSRSVAVFGMLEGLPAFASLRLRTGEVLNSIQIRADRQETESIRAGAIFVSDGSEEGEQRVFATFLVGDKL